MFHSNLNSSCFIPLFFFVWFAFFRCDFGHFVSQCVIFLMVILPRVFRTDFFSLPVKKKSINTMERRASFSSM